jgi:hypothetical protein
MAVEQERTMIEIKYPMSSSDAGAKRGYKPVLIAALTLTALTAGTAGAYPVDFDWTAPRTSIKFMDFRGPVDTLLHARDARSAAQLVANIRDVFGLKMSEVARIFGVSRRAVYDWLAGALPKGDLLTKMGRLSRQADEARDAGIDRMDHFVHRPVIGGRSLLDMLRADEDIERPLAIIKQTATDEERIRNSSALGNREIGPNRRGFDEVSTPIIS